MVIKWNMNNMEKDFWEVFLHLFFLMLWPVLTNWCIKGSYRSGRIPASREFLSFIRSLSKWECNVLNRELHRIHPISGTLPCFHYWSKGRIGKCATVVKLSWITVWHISEIFCLHRWHGRALLVTMDPENIVRVSRKTNMPEADRFFKVVARGESYHRFSH